MARIDHFEAARLALQENGLEPIDGRYPVELSVDDSVVVALVHSTLAVTDAIDRLLGFLEDRAITVRSE